VSRSAPMKIDFFDPEVNDCPYPAYQYMRDEEPVYLDTATGMYNVTRYDDIRAILLDTERFSNAVGQGANNSGKALKPVDPEEAQRQAAIAEQAAAMTRLYEEKGWVPAPSLDARDDPNHIQMRRLFDFAFRPAAIRDIDGYVEDLAYSLFDGFIEQGACEWVGDYAVPLPLYIIGHQMGVPDEDLPQIKIWTDAWIKRMGLMQTAEEMRWSVEMEIEGQHYFQQRFESLRARPDESLLSILVNREIPEWGRPLNDNELHAEMFADTFVGGSETATNALAEGVVMLASNKRVWDMLQDDPIKYIEPFCEEVLRLESPVQGLMRNTLCEVELHDVTIPEGAVVMLRFAAGNRDERMYGEKANEIDLERRHPRRHLAFGVGSHHCLGAPLARREMFHGFKALVDRVEDLWLVEGRPLGHHQNFFMRALKEVHLGFEAKRDWTRTTVARSADTRES
jgi:cytochrome P450